MVLGRYLMVGTWTLGGRELETSQTHRDDLGPEGLVRTVSLFGLLGCPGFIGNIGYSQGEKVVHTL